MKKTLFGLLVIFILSTQSHCFGQLYTEEGLYANGVKNYNNNNWQYASVYLFALIQKNPQAFATDLSFKQEVIKAFDHSMTQLEQQIKNGQLSLAPGQDGLHSKPPPLRPVSAVRLKKY